LKFNQTDNISNQLTCYFIKIVKLRAVVVVNGENTVRSSHSQCLNSFANSKSKFLAMCYIA